MMNTAEFDYSTEFRISTDSLKEANALLAWMMINSIKCRTEIIKENGETRYYIYYMAKNESYWKAINNKFNQISGFDTRF